MRLRSIVALGVVAGLALSACSSPRESGASSSESGADGAGGDVSGTLKVWLMPELPEDILKQVNDKFNESYPNVTVNVERQEWGTVEDRLSSFLQTDETPDVAEVRNSLTAKFGAAGSFMDLTDKTGELNADGWTGGLKVSTSLDGKTFAAPMYGAGRAVVYNTGIWEKAGLGDPPKTLDEFEAALGKLAKADSKASAFWFPGKYWYGALPWIWGFGGELAVDEGGSWKGAVDSQESRAGLSNLQGIVENYSKAPVDATEVSADGDQVQAFKDGKAVTALMLPWEIGSLEAEKPGLFALPGKDGEAAPQFLVGSNLAVSSKSANQEAALGWIRAYLDPDIQKAYAKETSNIPALSEATSALEGEIGEIQQKLAATGKFTPNDPTWANVETQEVLPDMTSEIIGGGSVDEATTQASEQITSIMG